MAVKKNVKLSQFVTYISAKGKQKAALVVGTPESVGEGTYAVPALAEDQLHLLVFSPTGNQYLRQSVPSKALAETEAEGAVAGGYFVV